MDGVGEILNLICVQVGLGCMISLSISSTVLSVGFCATLVWSMTKPTSFTIL